jgi:hypothetical protein
LIASVEELVSGDDWNAMLQIPARFHNYKQPAYDLSAATRRDARRRLSHLEVSRMLRAEGGEGLAIFAPCIYNRRIEVKYRTLKTTCS